MPQLIRLFGISRKTLHNWLTRWEDEKLLGLYDRPGRGKKPKIKSDQKEQIREWAKTDPKNLRKNLGKIQEKWGITISKNTLKKILKHLGMTLEKDEARVGRKA